MKKITLYIFIPLLLGCSKPDEVIYDEPRIIQIQKGCEGFVGCPEIQIVEESNITKCDEANNKTWCEIISLGNFPIEQESKSYLPQFCHDICTILDFENLEGDTLSFILSCKNYYQTKITYGSEQKCEDNRNKVFCTDTEFLEYKINCLNKNLDFKVRITTKLDVEYALDLHIGDVLQIIRDEGDTELASLINYRNLSRNILENKEEIYPTISLNNKIYNEIISNNISNFIGERYKFYYTKEKGLIGFTDLDSITWTLVE